MCSVVGCYSGHIGVQRFKLPEDPDMRFEWVQFLFEVNEQRFKESDWTEIAICSAHFTKDCFVKPASKNGSVQLKYSAVPSLFIKADEALEDPTSPEMATDDDVLSETDALDGRQGHTSEEEEEEQEEDNQERASSDEEWNPTDDFLLVKDSEEESEEEEEEDEEETFGYLWGLKINELCTECGSFYSQKPHTCEHKMKPFSCNICGKRCVNEISLKNHSRIHDETYEHPCKYCNVTFKTRMDKLNHEQYHQVNNDPYKCPDCPQTFTTRKKRNEHLSNHRTPDVIQCGICGIEFSQIHHLQRHSVVHTGLKPYKCSVCERGFNQASNLKSHMRLHTGERPYKCQHCDKSFNHNVSLKSHVQRYHTSSSGPDRNKRKKVKRETEAPDAEDNGNQKDSESEVDNGEGEHDTEEEVQKVKKTKVPQKKKKKTTGRPRGRPKAGDLNNKSIKSNLQKSNKTILSIEKGEDEKTDGDVSFDLEEEEEEEEEEDGPMRKSKGRSRGGPKEDIDSDFDLEEVTKKMRYSNQSSGKNSSKHVAEQRKIKRSRR
ncbi:uncharacterized protein LKV04_008989 [Tautogolabrus adspersus]